MWSNIKNIAKSLTKHLKIFFSQERGKFVAFLIALFIFLLFLALVDTTIVYRKVTGNADIRDIRFTLLENLPLEPDFTRKVNKLFLLNYSFAIMPDTSEQGKVRGKVTYIDKDNRIENFESGIFVLPQTTDSVPFVVSSVSEEEFLSFNLSASNEPTMKLWWERIAPELFQLSIKSIHLGAKGLFHSNAVKQIDLPKGCKIYDNPIDQITKYDQDTLATSQLKKLSSKDDYISIAGPVVVKFYSKGDGEVKMQFTLYPDTGKAEGQAIQLIRDTSSLNIPPKGVFKNLAFKVHQGAIIDLGEIDGQRKYVSGQDIVIYSDNLNLNEASINKEGISLRFVAHTNNVRSNGVPQLSGRVVSFVEKHRLLGIISALFATICSAFLIYTRLRSLLKSQKADTPSGLDKSPPD